MNHLRLIFLFCVLIISGCVSVQLGAGKSQKAKEIHFTNPDSPFKSIDSENADNAWQSQKTGNTLAFLTECQSAVEMSLKNLENESLNALTDLKILSNSVANFNERESSSTLAEGKMDGIPVKIALLVFKKNGCNFTLTFVGRKSTFDSEVSYYEKFKQSFRVE